MSIVMKKNHLFSSNEWQRVVKTGFGVNYLTLETSDLTILNLQYKSFFWVRIYGSPLPGTFTNYINAINVSSNFNELRYWENFIKYKFAALIVKKNNFTEPLENDLPKNCVSIVSRGARIPHAKFSANLSYLPQKTRNIVRKGLRENTIYKATAADIDELIDKHYSNLVYTFSKQGMGVPHPIKAYQAIKDHLILGVDYFLFLSYSNDGQITGSALFLRESDIIIFHSGGNTALGLKTAASSALQYSGQMLANSMGLDYDFGGLGIDSIDSFKLSFNPDVYTVTTFIFGNIIFRKLLYYVLSKRN